MLIHIGQCIILRVTSWYVKVKEKEGIRKRKTNTIRTTYFLNINYYTWGKRALCFLFFLSRAQSFRPGVIHPGCSEFLTAWDLLRGSGVVIENAFSHQEMSLNTHYIQSSCIGTTVFSHGTALSHQLHRLPFLQFNLFTRTYLLSKKPWTISTAKALKSPMYTSKMFPS